MSREQVYTDLFAMLSGMTLANGYSRTYTPVKSVDNDSATMKQTPFISLHFGTEAEVPFGEGSSFEYYRAELPVEVTARVKVPHNTRSEIEYIEDVQRSQVVDDIKQRFSIVSGNVTGCFYFEAEGEEEARLDSNKNDMYVKYIFTCRYKTLRQQPTT